MSAVEVDGRRVVLSNLDRVLWPLTGFTKRDLVDYYRAVAPALVPHLRGRPVTLWRFPQGVHERGWWQNECRGAPDWLATALLRDQRFCLVEDTASLLWLANQGTIELHPFAALAADPDRPTVAVFDLDPGPPAGVLECCEVALSLREALAARGLTALAKTTGSVGLHVYVPLNAPHSFEGVKAFARSLADELAAERPDRVVATMRRSERAGKVLVDWLQNDPTRSTVAPYSLRATPAPTVSTPVEWEEVERALHERRPELLVFLWDAALARLARHGDLFAPVLELRQTIAQ